MKTKFKSTLRAMRYSFSGVVCGSILLIASSTPAQNMFVSEGSSGKIYEFTPSGSQSTFASGLNWPEGLAFDGSGNLFEADNGSGNIYEFTPDGTRSTFASGLNDPFGLAFDGTGNLFVADQTIGSIYEYSPSGARSTFASGMDYPVGLAFDRAGNLFVSCSSDYIIKITPGGEQTASGYGLSVPLDLAFDSAGDLFVANEQSTAITKVTPDGTKSIFGYMNHIWSVGLAIDSTGNLFVANDDDLGHGITKFTPSGVRSILAYTTSVYPLFIAFQPVPELHAAVVNGAFQLSVAMPSPYYSTIVQASTNFVDWVNVYTNTPPFTFTDTTSPTSRHHFYRAVVGP